MDAGADDDAALGPGLERRGHQRADRWEGEGGVEQRGRRFQRRPGPVRAEIARDPLGKRIAGPGEGIALAALEHRDLGDEVRRRAESIEAEPPRIARHAQRAMSDEPRAEQRRGLGVPVALRQRKAVALVGDCVLGVSTVELVSGEARQRAEVLPAALAEDAYAARPTQPRHSDTPAFDFAADLE